MSCKNRRQNWPMLLLFIYHRYIPIQWIILVKICFANFWDLPMLRFNLHQGYIGMWLKANGFGAANSDLDWFCEGSAHCSKVSATDHLCQHVASTVRAHQLFKALPFEGCFPSCTRLSLPLVKTQSGCGDSIHILLIYLPPPFPIRPRVSHSVQTFIWAMWRPGVFYWVSSVKLLFIPPLVTFNWQKVCDL